MSVPNGWMAGIVQDVVGSISAGRSVNSIGVPAAEGHAGVLKTSAVTSGVFRPEENKQIHPDEIHQARVGVQAGTIILCRSNTASLVGSSARIDEDFPLLHLSDKLWQIRVNDTTDPAWFQYFLTLPSTREAMRGGTSGSAAAMKNISKPSFSGIKVLLPPLPEQRKIAEILRTWDDAIERVKNLYTTLVDQFELVTKSIYQFSEQNGIGTTFGQILSESRMPGSDGASAEKITVKLYGKGAVAKTGRVGSASTKYFQRMSGQLIYSKLDFLNGAFAIVPEELDGFQSTLDLPAFDINGSINPTWLIEYLIRPTYYEQQTHMAVGQRKARRISPKEFLDQSVRVPSREKQDEYGIVLETARTEIRSVVEYKETLKRQKRGLMQQLLTGKIRVNVGHGEETSV